MALRSRPSQRSKRAVCPSTKITRWWVKRLTPRPRTFSLRYSFTTSLLVGGPTHSRSRGRSGSGAAPLVNNHYKLLQVVLFWAGAVLLPLGLVVIVLGWYGAANTPYEYDQISYLVSGGLLGLGLTFTGGFLYFGAWLARIADDGRESSKRLADTLLVLADVTSRAAAVSAPATDAAALPVVAGDGTTLHRRAPS